jgi:hypothetical protein
MKSPPATNPDAASEDQELIDMAAATFLEVDQGQFEEAFELLVRCHTRDLLSAHPDSPPDQIIACVQDFIEAVTRRVEQIRAAGGTHKGRA